MIVHTWELTNEDLDELISEENNDDDVAIQTDLNCKAPAKITKIQGVLMDETAVCDLVKAVSLKFKRKVKTVPRSYD
jgi:hypothetical protein